MLRTRSWVGDGSSPAAARRSARASVSVMPRIWMLPREVNVPLSSGKKRKYSHRVTYSIYGNESRHGNYRVGLNHGTAIFQYSEYAGTEADARAKMLLYLLENKLISFS